MSEQVALDQRYMVNVYQTNETGKHVVSFGPKGPMHERGPGGPPMRVPQYIVAVRQEANGLIFDWSATQDDPGAARGEMEAEVAIRLNDKAIWIDRVTALIGQVEQWAKQLGWSSRRLDKQLDDLWIGKHHVPALIMQEDTCKVVLEPVGRSSPGAEGVVDLYLMPAYDDVARLYYYDGRWNLHHSSADAKAVTVRDSQATLLSKETFEKVLAELTQHVA
jgi:hypothetical protein